MHAAHPNRVLRQFSVLLDELYCQRSFQNHSHFYDLFFLCVLFTFSLERRINAALPRMQKGNIQCSSHNLRVWDLPLDITHNNSYVCTDDSSFQTHPLTGMPLLVFTVHSRAQQSDWFLFPLINFISCSRLGGAVFQRQWIIHPRQGKTHISIMDLGTLTGSSEMYWTRKEGLSKTVWGWEDA